ncbi:hypothetical protein [Methyloceanibacter sp.]|uniref:hypothetical protein n=1 Tax=Methyloceanibacter sp. TaxID=1965321 RepID=UPI002BF6EE0E|nr:hypothetical protein [Methyloceanibacter sp.]HML91837.1 hypothetical protein [Methyloceanibacter sp.]
MAILIGVLVAVAVAAVVAWWLFDFDAPEIVVPVAAPGAGALFVYWYGASLAWAVGAALLIVACAVAYFLVRRSRARKTAPPG